MISTTPQLHALAAYVRRNHLRELAEENLRILTALDAPLLKMFAHLPADELLAMSIAGLETFLGDLEAGRALEAAAETLRQWEEDRLEGIPQASVSASDMVLVSTAQKQAIMAFIDRFATDARTAMALVLELEAFYTTTQTASFKVFTRLREEAAQRLARAEAEREAAVAQSDQLQSLNEEMTAQSEELQQQAEELQANQEELEGLYETLKARNEVVEAEVAERTLRLQTLNEELQAANEELQDQADDLAEQQALTERIIENTPAGVAFLDSELVYRRLNEAYAVLMGMTVDQVLDKSIYEVFPGATDQFEGLMREVMATGVPYRTVNFPFRFMLNGEEKLTYWDFTYQPVLDKDDKTGILILEVEVSDRQERERLQTEQIAQLQELDRYKDQFLSVISHELRTPLNFITGFASTLADEVQGRLNDRQHEAIAKILNGSDRMLMLVDDLLDFAKIQSGRFDLAPVTTNYGELVAEVLGLLKPLADQKQLSIEIDVPAGLLASLDGSRIAQVLTNLLSNAIKFTDAGGRVAVRAAVRDGELLTEVVDTGCGIASEHHDKLFTHFQQLDMSNTRQAGGTGLGLAISKALIEAHQGRIGLNSEPERGSTFWFSVPLA